MTDRWDEEAEKALPCDGALGFPGPAAMYVNPAGEWVSFDDYAKQAERIAELENEAVWLRVQIASANEFIEVRCKPQAERVKELERALVTMANWDNDKAFGGYDQETALHLSDVLLSARRAIGGEQEEGK